MQECQTKKIYFFNSSFASFEKTNEPDYTKASKIAKSEGEKYQESQTLGWIYCNTSPCTIQSYW
jgi:hypothetical protein